MLVFFWFMFCFPYRSVDIFSCSIILWHPNIPANDIHNCWPYNSIRRCHKKWSKTFFDRIIISPCCTQVIVGMHAISSLISTSLNPFFIANSVIIDCISVILSVLCFNLFLLQVTFLVNWQSLKMGGAVILYRSLQCSSALQMNEWCAIEETGIANLLLPVELVCKVISLFLS